MALQITGKILRIEPINSIPTRNGGTFNKREFVLDCTRYNPDTGEPWENYPKFEIVGQRCSMLDGFNEGDKVQVSFTLSGNKYVKDGVERFFTSIVAYAVEYVDGGTQSQPQSQSFGPTDDEVPF